MRKRIPLILIPLLLAGCSHSGLTRSFRAQWDREAMEFAGTLEALYPPGAERSKILETRNEPPRTAVRPVSGNWRDFEARHRKAFLRPILHFEKQTGFRAATVDLIYAAPAKDDWDKGLYWDYVFYDHEGKVQGSHRHFAQQ